MAPTLLLVGGGKMGSALLKGLLGAGWATAGELARRRAGRTPKASTTSTPASKATYLTSTGALSTVANPWASGETGSRDLFSSKARSSTVSKSPRAGLNPTDA